MEKTYNELTQEALTYFLDLIAIPSTADDRCEACPSSEGQWLVARRAAEILKGQGIEPEIDEHGYLMAKIPANCEGVKYKLGFIAHMDTAPDFKGTDIKARIEHFDGKIVLDAEGKYQLDCDQFPQMKSLIGHDLVVTDGRTLLSADDKAGMAAILALVAHLQKHPEIKHGELRIAFTPDEEIGRGAHLFDVAKFDADFAYTVDGGEEGELEAESFNAAGVTLCYHGKSVHPGSAKNKMINAQWLAHEFMSQLDPLARPEHTEGREGFNHLLEMTGDVESVTQRWIIRDFTSEGFAAKKADFERIAENLRTKYGEEAVDLEIKDQYFNMYDIIAQHPFLLELAEKAYHSVGVEPKLLPIRGGTDGSQLSFKGLPCPNLFTGGGNAHGRFEYLSIPEFGKCVEVLIALVEQFAQIKA